MRRFLNELEFAVDLEEREPNPFTHVDKSGQHTATTQLTPLMEVSEKHNTGSLFSGLYLIANL